MAKVKLTLEQFRDRMGRINPIVSQGIIGGMRAGLLLALKDAKRNAPIKTGALRDSIRVIEPIQSSDGFTGGLRAGGPKVPYAGIHEHGGVTRPHIIVPKHAKALSWIDKTGGVRRFAMRVRHPGSRIPARPYLYPAIEGQLAQISKQISVAIEVAFAKGLRG